MSKAEATHPWGDIGWRAGPRHRKLGDKPVDRESQARGAHAGKHAFKPGGEAELGSDIPIVTVENEPIGTKACRDLDDLGQGARARTDPERHFMALVEEQAIVAIEDDQALVAATGRSEGPEERRRARSDPTCNKNIGTGGDSLDEESRHGPRDGSAPHQLIEVLGRARAFANDDEMAWLAWLGNEREQVCAEAVARQVTLNARHARVHGRVCFGAEASEHSRNRQLARKGHVR